MNYKIVLILSVLLSLVTSLVTTYLTSGKEGKKKYAYVLTQEIFDNYKGTKVVQEKLNKLQQQQEYIIDSIAMGIKLMESKMSKNDAKLIKAKENFNQLYRQLTADNKNKTDEYKTGIWKQINQYLSEYGKQKKLDYIYGADGTGNIMYADSSLNVTKEATDFINEKYAGE